MDIAELWRRAASACPLHDLRLSYISHIRAYSGSSDVPVASLGTSDLFDSIPAGLAGVGKCVQSVCSQVERDVKNKMAARSVSRGGGGALLTLPPPPRLQVTNYSNPAWSCIICFVIQEDLDCVLVDALGQIFSLFTAAGMTERVFGLVQVSEHTLD